MNVNEAERRIKDSEKVREDTDKGVHLKELESLCLKCLGGQRGEGVPQTLLTEAQHFTFPQSRVCTNEQQIEKQI